MDTAMVNQTFDLPVLARRDGKDFISLVVLVALVVLLNPIEVLPVAPVTTSWRGL